MLGISLATGFPFSPSYLHCHLDEAWSHLRKESN